MASMPAKVPDPHIVSGVITSPIYDIKPDTMWGSGTFTGVTTSTIYDIEPDTMSRLGTFR